MSAITFTSVSKKYTLNLQSSRSIQELFIRTWKREKPVQKELWVLNDVSFSIEPGEAVAFIGPNGAGKSTVLKLASSIVTPTAGTIELNGRISSLLELGTGFHPDLTGRENVYLNGSILGLSRKEIDRKYDDILAFAEIDDYIDLPVKHYSSGMYLRLAFAVASYVDPDILLIDEVIAVGDHIFQQRCFKRLAQLQQAGVTFVLISHSTELLKKYCTRGIWLEHGQIQADGDIDWVIESYLTAQHDRQVKSKGNTPTRISLEEFQTLTERGTEVQRWGTGDVEITDVKLLNSDYEPQTTYVVGETLTIRMYYQVAEPVQDPIFGIAIYRADNIQVNGPNTKEARYPIQVLRGYGYIDYTVETLNLLPGNYEISVAVYDYEAIQSFDHHHRVYRFQVLAGLVGETTGLVYLPSRWVHQPQEAVESSLLESISTKES